MGAETQDDVVTFAKDLTAARADAGRSVREVHRLTGIPTATLGGYFSGRHLPPTTRPEILEAVLAACDVPRRQWGSWRTRLLALHDQRRQVVVRRTPYPGLGAFSAEDHDLFFGREQVLDALLGLVGDAAGSDLPVAAVVGPSGAGKSSLLRAGLQAALAGMSCTVLTPVLLAEQGMPQAAAGDDGGPVTGGAQQVVIVDQLEELWTHPGGSARPEEVLTDLLRWATDGPRRVLVLGLRADFYGEASRHPGLAQVLRTRQILVEPMDIASMRAAIEGPARQVGLGLEPGLVDVILADVRADDVGSVLPHLAHVLDTMWRASDRRALTVEGYRAAGGFEGAIRLSAESAMEALAPEQRQVARRLLLRMVTAAPGRGWTRRLVPISELAALAPAAPEVLDHLVDTRLVTARTDDATLSHESLIGAWPRLREWVEASRGDLARREALDRATRDWDTSGRSEDHLLRGGRLASTTEWLESAQERLTPTQQDYVAASRALADQLRSDRARARRRRRAMVAALTALLLVTTTATVLAVGAWGTVRDQRDRAQSRQLAVAADNQRASHPGLSQQLAVAAHRAAPTREGRSALLDATTSPVITAWQVQDAVPERAVTMVGGTLAVAGPDGGLTVLAPTESTTEPWRIVARLPTLPGSDAPVLGRLAAHPDLPLVVAGGTVSADPDAAPLLVAVDLSDPSSPRSYELSVPSGPTGLAFVDGGRALLVADRDLVLHRYPTDPGAEEAVAREPVGGSVEVGELVEWLAASDDGSVVAAALTDGRVRAWRAEDGELVDLGEVRTPRGLFALDVAPDGSAVAAVGRSGLVHWLSVEEDALTQTQDPYASDTNLFAVHVDERSGLLVTAGFDGTVSMWRVGPDGPLTETPSLVLPVGRPVIGMDVTDEGRWLFATLGGTLYSWDERGAALPRLAGNVFVVGTGAEGDRYLTVTGPPDGRAYVWDAARPHAPTLLHSLSAPGDDLGTGAAAISRDGRVVAMGTGEGHLVVWRLEEGRAVQVLDTLATPEGVVNVVLTPDGDRAVALGRQGAVVSLSLAGADAGEVLATRELPGGSVSVALSRHGLLAASDDQGNVLVTDLDDLNGGVVLDLDANVYGLDFSPTEPVLALTGSDDTVHLYDVSDPARPRAADVLSGPSSITSSVKFSPDGERIAVAVTEGQAWIYTRQVEGWQATEVLRAGLVNLQDVTWSADGRVLLGGALGGRTRVWLTDVTRAEATVCAGIGQDVTREVWDGLLPGIPYAPPCHATEPGADPTTG